MSRILRLLLLAFALAIVLPASRAGAVSGVTGTRFVVVDAKVKHTRVERTQRRCGFWRKRCRGRGSTLAAMTFEYNSPKTGQTQISRFSRKYPLAALPSFFEPEPRPGQSVKVLVDSLGLEQPRIPCTRSDRFISRLYCTAI